MEDVKLKDQDIVELFNRMPEANREAIIIAQERMIKELKDQNLELSKKNLNGVKKVKAGVQYSDNCMVHDEAGRTQAVGIDHGQYHNEHLKWKRKRP